VYDISSRILFCFLALFIPQIVPKVFMTLGAQIHLFCRLEFLELFLVVLLPEFIWVVLWFD